MDRSACKGRRYHHNHGDLPKIKHRADQVCPKGIGICILSSIDIPHGRKFREHTCLITVDNDHDNTRFVRACCLNLRSLVTTSNFDTSNPAILVDYDPNDLRPFFPYIISASRLFLTDIDVLIYLRRVSTERSM